MTQQEILQNLMDECVRCCGVKVGIERLEEIYSHEKKFHETYGKTTEDPYFAMAICNDGALRSFVTLPWYIIKLHKPYAYVYLSELGKFIKNLSNENHHHPHGLVA